MNNEVRVKKAYYSYSNMPFSMKGEQRIMMQDWFRKARLGIFIHYGIYAVGDVSESWSFHNGNISYEDYMVSPLPNMIRKSGRLSLRKPEPTMW